MRPGLRLAVLGCLVGAGLVLLALSRPWLDYQVVAIAPLPSRHVRLDGAQLVGGSQALGLVGLAAVAGLLATRTWGRQLIGVLVTLTGIGVVVDVVRALADPTATAHRVTASVPAGVQLGPWPYAAVAGGLLVAASGALVVLRGRSWVGLGARYEAPVAQRPVSDGDTWSALDRGEDPTAVGQ